MASPDRVTDELVELRYRFYSDPDVQASLRRVFENAFAFQGAPRRQIDESELAQIAVPTLVLWTDRNPGAGPEIGRRIASRIPGAQFHCLTDAAHWPQWEQPEAHDRVVTDFLLGGSVDQPADPDATAAAPGPSRA
jgi:pimeloyl-ACP methyl ester carboxylesterase